jgi:hypothetical protein
MKKSPKIAKKFTCETCDYNTSNRFDYNKHLLTIKHQKRTKSMIINDYQYIEPKKSQDDKWDCSYCNKKYKDYSGLWRHSRLCRKPIESTQTVPIEQSNNELIMLLINQNNELQKQLIGLSKERNNYIFNHNNTTNNNRFNLNFFLNERCKDAVNINDFIKSLQIQLSDLETTSKIGFVEGITQLFVKGLKELDIYKRPIHCSDLKREILYVKNENKWEKDDDDKAKIKTVINTLAKKSIQQIPVWKSKHPEYNNPDSKQNEHYIKIVSNIMSGSTEDEQNKNMNQIIKNVAKEVLIAKDKDKDV